MIAEQVEQACVNNRPVSCCNISSIPFDTSNEAYKLGVNYLIYGAMH